MSALQPDQTWLRDTVTVELYLDEGDYNVPSYAKPVTLEKVRVDLTKDFVGTGSDRTITANATVFLIAKYTTNYPAIDDSWLQARLTYNGHEYKVVNWSAYQEPDTGTPFSIELKVI
ncbi:putative minor capsid protein [Lacticaseibacillus daqingensis]|uniref:putative minor capsid protein n=1 Tax=Lacticaseibacillus daqingensis TaxID=2486014 RepID=UPI000F7A04E6|nr:putative minor capsid protein [Lacticaseibacillus daqingensis]